MGDNILDFLNIPVSWVHLEAARRSLLEFSRITWSGFRVNWHHKLICDTIDRLLSGKTSKPNLMIFAPPRHGKSQLCTRNLPAYFLGRYPDKEVLCCSYTADLAFRLSKDTLNIMRSDIYKRLFPDVTIGKSETNPFDKSTIKRDLFTIAGRRGSYRAAGVGGGITGMGFSLGIIDDPFKDAEHALSQSNRNKVWEWYRTTFSTRKSANAKQLLIMTRWHHDDLAGRLLKEQGDQWEVVSLPGLSSPHVNLHPLDPRQGTVNVPLWPDEFGYEHHRIMKSLMGFWYGAMYDQMPVPEGAGLFKTDRIGTFWHDDEMIHVNGKAWPHERIYHFATVDLAASEKHQSDYTVISFFGMTPERDLCVKEVCRQRVPVNDVSEWLANQCRRYPETIAVGVEITGFQMAVVKDMRTNYQMPPIIELKPESKSKMVRATAAIIAMETGKIFVPHHAEWVNSWKNELAAFTGNDDPHDDMVDSLAYAFRMNSGIIQDSIESVDTETKEREIFRTKINKYFRR